MQFNLTKCFFDFKYSFISNARSNIIIIIFIIIIKKNYFQLKIDKVILRFLKKLKINFLLFQIFY